MKIRKRRRQGQRVAPGADTRFLILAAARARLRDHKPIHKIKLSELAKACGVTRAAAAWHFPRGIASVGAGLAVQLWFSLYERFRELPAPATSDARLLQRVGGAIFDILLDEPDTTAAVQSMRWGWAKRDEGMVSEATSRVFAELEKRLPPNVDPPVVLGLAEHFFSEVRRKAMTARLAERRFIDLLQRMAGF